MLKPEVDAQEHVAQRFGKSIRAGFETHSRHPPCPKTLLAWMKQFERCGYTPLALLPKRRSVTSTYRHFSKASEDLLAECVVGYLDPNRPTKKKITDDVRLKFCDLNETRMSRGLPALKVLAPLLTGRTFSNPVERGDYPSEQRAALTDDDLARVLTLFFVQIYHNSPHAGLNGESPANAWKRLVAEQGVTSPPDANRRRAVFGLQVSRKLDRHGVRAFGIHFTCPKLQVMLLHERQREVVLRVDPADLTYVSVLIGNDWHPAKAVSQAVWGLSLDQWQTIVRDLRTTFRDQARLAEMFIFKARKRVTGVNHSAQEFIPLKFGLLTVADLERLEANLFLGLSIGPPNSSATGPPADGANGLLDDVIQPHGTASHAMPEQAEEEKPSVEPGSGKTRWRFSRD